MHLLNVAFRSLDSETKKAPEGPFDDSTVLALQRLVVVCECDRSLIYRRHQNAP